MSQCPKPSAQDLVQNKESSQVCKPGPCELMATAQGEALMVYTGCGGEYGKGQGLLDHN